MAKKTPKETFEATLHEYTPEYAEIVSKRNHAMGLKPYMFCTDKRGVFFGYCDPNYKDLSTPMLVRDMRNCILWSAQVSGAFGLSDVGPIGWENDSSRVGARTQEAEMPGITARCLCSDRAELVWNTARPKARES